jgi:hypothetical protein
MARHIWGAVVKGWLNLHGRGTETDQARQVNPPSTVNPVNLHCKFFQRKNPAGRITRTVRPHGSTYRGGAESAGGDSAIAPEHSHQAVFARFSTLGIQDTVISTATSEDTATTAWIKGLACPQSVAVSKKVRQNTLLIVARMHENGQLRHFRPISRTSSWQSECKPDFVCT